MLIAIMIIRLFSLMIYLVSFRSVGLAILSGKDSTCFYPHPLAQGARSVTRSHLSTVTLGTSLPSKGPQFSPLKARVSPNAWGWHMR